MWTFGGKNSSASNSWHTEWQDPPKTPRPRSKSRSRAKGKGSTKSGKSSSKQGGKDTGYSAGDGTTPWRQSSSVLESLGLAMPDASSSKASAQSTPKDGANLEQVLNGLRSHLKTLGQEVTPEVETFLLQKAGNTAQAIRMASQKLESSQKAATKLKNEINQQKVQWKKFQDKISEEYEAQLAKYQERQASLRDALRKAGEEYAEAKKTLQEAASEEVGAEPIEQVPPSNGVPPETSKSPKRKTEEEKAEGAADALAKRLKQNVQEISDEELMEAVAEKTNAPVPSFR